MPVIAARLAGRSVAGGVASYRVAAMNHAEQKKDAALSTKATLRPAISVTTPPTEAPTASIADHIALASAFAGSSSSSDVMFGIVAVRAGSKKAAALIVSAMTTYAIHTSPGRRTNSNPSMRNPRTMSAAIIRRRRFTRSTTTPAIGPTTATGRNWTIIIHATAVADPVRSRRSA